MTYRAFWRGFRCLFERGDFNATVAVAGLAFLQRFSGGTSPSSGAGRPSGARKAGSHRATVLSESRFSELVVTLGWLGLPAQSNRLTIDSCPMKMTTLKDQKGGERLIIDGVVEQDTHVSRVQPNGLMAVMVWSSEHGGWQRAWNQLTALPVEELAK